MQAQRPKNCEKTLGISLIVLSLLILPKALLYDGFSFMQPYFQYTTDGYLATQIGLASLTLGFALTTVMMCSLIGGIGVLKKQRTALKIALIGQIALFISSIWFLALGISLTSVLLPIVLSLFLIAYLSDLLLNQKISQKITKRLPSASLSVHSEKLPFQMTQDKKVA